MTYLHKFRACLWRFTFKLNYKHVFSFFFVGILIFSRQSLCITVKMLDIWISHDEKICMTSMTKRFVKLQASAHWRKDVSTSFLSDVRHSQPFHLLPLFSFSSLISSYLSLSISCHLLLAYEIDAKVPHLHGQIRDIIHVFFTVFKSCFYTCSKHERNVYILYTYFIILLNLFIKIWTSTLTRALYTINYIHYNPV